MSTVRVLSQEQFIAEAQQRGFKAAIFPLGIRDEAGWPLCHVRIVKEPYFVGSCTPMRIDELLDADLDFFIENITRRQAKDGQQIAPQD